MDNRIIYVVSDSVGETAELVVKASLSQFNGSADDTHIRRIPYVEDIGTINEVVSRQSGRRHYLFYARCS